MYVNSGSLKFRYYIVLSQVNSNGVISLPNFFEEYEPAPFPFMYLRMNATMILCPFWDDADPSAGGNIYHSSLNTTDDAISKASHLIQATLGRTFHPIAVFTATWDHVSHYNGSSLVSLRANHILSQ